MNTQNLDDMPLVTKSKRGRKAHAVSEGYIDTTGRTHIMTVRRANPPTSKKKTSKAPKVIKQSNTYYRRCEQNDEYIDVLNDRIGKLESLVNKLTNDTKQNNNTQKNPQTLSNIGTEDLFNLSNQISIELFERFGMQNQMQAQIATPTTISTPDIGVPYQFVSTIPLSHIGLEVPLNQIQLQTQLVAPTTTSTSTFSALNERIERLESLFMLTNTKDPQSISSIGTENTFNILKIQTQREATNPTSSPSYELEDSADWSFIFPKS